MGFPGGTCGKNPSVNAGDVKDLASIQGLEDPLEEVMVTHCSILALRISWTEKAGGLQSMGLHRVGHD